MESSSASKRRRSREQQHGPPPQEQQQLGAGDGAAAAAAAISAPQQTPPDFRPIGTVKWASFGIAMSAVMIVLVFGLPLLCNPHNKEHQSCPLEPLSFLLYSHVAHWVLHLIVDQVLKQRHKTFRLDGFCDFYLQTVKEKKTLQAIKKILPKYKLLGII